MPPVELLPGLDETAAAPTHPCPFDGDDLRCHCFDSMEGDGMSAATHGGVADQLTLAQNEAATVRRHYLHEKALKEQAEARIARLEAVNVEMVKAVEKLCLVSRPDAALDPDEWREIVAQVRKAKAMAKEATA